MNRNRYETVQYFIRELDGIAFALESIKRYEEDEQHGDDGELFVYSRAADSIGVAVNDITDAVSELKQIEENE